MRPSDYFYIRHSDGVVVGPFSFLKIESMRQQGRLSLNDRLSKDKMHWFALEGRTVCAEALELPEKSVSAAPTPVEESPAPLAPTPDVQVTDEATMERNDIDDMQEQVLPAEEKLPAGWEAAAAGKVLAALILGAVWQGAMYFRVLEHRLKPLRWCSLVYSLAVCLGVWQLYPPERLSIQGSSMFGGVVLGFISWLFLVCVGGFDAMLCCLLSMRYFHWDDSSRASVWLSVLRNGTLYGAVMILRYSVMSETPWRVVPCLLLGGLFLWNEVCHWRIMGDYVKRRLEVTNPGWMLAVFLTSVIYLEGIVFVVINFGGYR